MHYLLIRNARLPRPDGSDEQTSVLMANGQIISIGAEAQHPLTDTTEIDAAGCYVMPALLSFINPRPAYVDEDSLMTMNFENATAGITTIMTVSPNIEDNMAEMRAAKCPLLNYAFHFPLGQISLAESKHFYRIIIREGVSTAVMRMGDERHDTPIEMEPHVTAARILRLRVIFDMRGIVGRKERMWQLKDLCNLLAQDKNNMAYIVGIEHDDELAMVKDIVGKCDVAVHLSFDAFEHGKDGKLSAETIARTLRENSWASLGLAYSATKAIKERWPDMTPEIVSRNKLPLVNTLPSETMLTPYELAEFTVGRPAEFVGLRPSVGLVREGSSANLLIWNHLYPDDAQIAAPRGDIQDLPLRGRVEYVIMNGNVVVGDKFNPNAVCGKHFYSRNLK